MAGVEESMCVNARYVIWKCKKSKAVFKDRLAFIVILTGCV